MRISASVALIFVLATVSTYANEVDDPVAAFHFGQSDVIRPAPIVEAENQN